MNKIVLICFCIINIIIVSIFCVNRFTYVTSEDGAVLANVCVMVEDNNKINNDITKLIDIVGSVDVSHKRNNIDIVKDIRRKVNKNLDELEFVWKPIQVTGQEIRLFIGERYERRIVLTRTTGCDCEGCE